ncbi:hypothetical protein B0H16DRAFT_1473451 [Mycena metata]|uniref:Uncharacterized protein n=1 Tax=Mycena metata TaxID=1033252 RepID=A0AAD7ML96_9AGAR|nr:hypothetical protein B0H16DRAFT_1473451 [Mycena metata]
MPSGGITALLEFRDHMSVPTTGLLSSGSKSWNEEGDSAVESNIRWPTWFTTACALVQERREVRAGWSRQSKCIRKKGFAPVTRTPDNRLGGQVLYRTKFWDFDLKPSGPKLATVLKAYFVESWPDKHRQLHLDFFWNLAENDQVRKALSTSSKRIVPTPHRRRVGYGAAFSAISSRTGQSSPVPLPLALYRLARPLLPSPPRASTHPYDRCQRDFNLPPLPHPIRARKIRAQAVLTANSSSRKLSAIRSNGGPLARFIFNYPQVLYSILPKSLPAGVRSEAVTGRGLFNLGCSARRVLWLTSGDCLLSTTGRLPGLTALVLSATKLLRESYGDLSDGYEMLSDLGAELRATTIRGLVYGVTTEERESRFSRVDSESPTPLVHPGQYEGDPEYEGAHEYGTVGLGFKQYPLKSLMVRSPRKFPTGSRHGGSACHWGLPLLEPARNPQLPGVPCCYPRIFPEEHDEPNFRQTGTRLSYATGINTRSLLTPYMDSP